MSELPDELPEGILMMIRSPSGRILAIKEETPRGTIKEWMRLRRQEVRAGTFTTLGDRQLTLSLK